MERQLTSCNRSDQALMPVLRAVLYVGSQVCCQDLHYHGQV